MITTIETLLASEESLDAKLDILTNLQLDTTSETIREAARSFHDALCDSLPVGRATREVPNDGPEVLPDTPEQNGSTDCAGDEGSKEEPKQC